MRDADRIRQIDKQYVWHPYTPMGEYIESTVPLVVTGANGSRLELADGRSLIDGNASWWTALLGHRHPRLLQALARQAERFCHVPLAGIAHEPAALLAEELVKLAPPGLSRVFFSDDGSTAVEVALKMSLQYWHQNGRPKRQRFVALSAAFHGETLGASALGGVEVFRRPFTGVLLDCIHVRPGEYEAAFSELEQVVERESDALAAVVLEPVVQGAAGMRIYDPRLLSAARAITEKHDVLLVLDEVFTGYGRTGPMWAAEHAGVRPDLLCTAKGFSGGLFPMAATLVSDRIFQGFLGEPERAFFYGHTFCGNPLGASVAREVLSIYRDDDILKHAIGKAQRIARAFDQMGNLPGVTGARHIGMIGALDLEGDGGYLARAGWRVYEEALELGAYLRPLGNVVYVAPALNIADDELDELLGIVERAVRSVTSSR